MNDQHTAIEFVKVVLRNDDQTPFENVVQTLRLVFGKDEREAREIARMANWLGRFTCGVYPIEVAKVFLQEAEKYASALGHAPQIELEPLVDTETGQQPICSFCGKLAGDVRKLHAGKSAHICDGCLIVGAEGLSADISSQRFQYVYELLEWHFPGCPKEHITSSVRSFPERVRADLQHAAEALFAAKAIKTIAIHGGYDYEQTTITTLLQRDRNAKTLGPLRYQDVDVGADEPVKCVENALWLLSGEGVPYVVLIVRQKDMRGSASMNIEIAAPTGEAGRRLVESHFRALESAVAQAASYRGKVLSLEQTDMYSGMANGIQVHRLPAIAREDIILPEKTMQLLDRNIIQFAAHRASLRKLGQSGKKGLLFHGPPGTGKTHTVRYLAAALPGHTTLLITSEQVALLPEYFTLARLLQPSIIVIEDADLIARDRSKMESACEEVLLNKLLNEMDGLKPDAEVFFILTTNRPEMLEAALASRPGRIDQAIEFPLPDEDGRRKLVALYGRGLKLARPIIEEIVTRTVGVSASFIKELMRRTAQYNLERGDEGEISETDASAAMEEMLFSSGRLNRALLGSLNAPRQSTGE
jgi:AAA+ superfamily predicted ATPase/ATP-dependent Clp protease adapter protein ClpS